MRLRAQGFLLFSESQIQTSRAEVGLNLSLGRSP